MKKGIKAERRGSNRWKKIVLRERWWPETLIVPRPDMLPLAAEHFRENSDWSQNFMFYLFRDPHGIKYYFRAWRNDNGETGTLRRDCVELNPVEAERLMILQEINQTLADDARRFRTRLRKGRNR